MAVCVCPNCHRCHETSEENANAPTWQNEFGARNRWCRQCSELEDAAAADLRLLVRRTT